MTYIEFLLFLSILPSIALGVMIYKKDIVEKESTGLLFKLFLGGAIGSVILTLLLSTVLEPIIPDLEDSNNNFIYLAINTFFKVALVEEFSKWIFLKKITWKNKEFNYIYDAIVYAVFVALGFATIENIIYVLGSEGGISIAILRAILSVPGHAFDGVFMGYYYGLAKQAKINDNIKLFKRNMIFSLLIPVVFHFIFDYLLLSENSILLILYLVFIILLYINAFKRINKLSNITERLDKNDDINNNSYNIVEATYQTNTINHRYCTNCGNLVNGNFCIICGKKVE